MSYISWTHTGGAGGSDDSRFITKLQGNFQPDIRMKVYINATSTNFGHLYTLDVPSAQNSFKAGTSGSGMWEITYLSSYDYCSQYISPATYTIRVTAVSGSQKLYLENTAKINATRTGTLNTINTYILCPNLNSPKVYYITFLDYYTQQIKADFQPAYNKKLNKYGFYDTVNKYFIQNSASAVISGA